MANCSCSITGGRGDRNTPSGFASPASVVEGAIFAQKETPEGFPGGSDLLTLLFKSDSWGVFGSWVSRRLAVLDAGRACRWARARDGMLVARGSCGGLCRCTLVGSASVRDVLVQEQELQPALC